MNYFFQLPILNKFKSHTPKGFYDAVKGHSGIDLACPMGTSLSLPVETQVMDVKQQKEMGLTLYLAWKQYILVFAHLSVSHGPAGAKKAADTEFARTGNSGSKTTGAHLHFECISKTPDPRYKEMTRTLGEFKGFNVDPMDVLAEMQTPEVSDAQKAYEWMKTNEILTKDHQLDSKVTIGTLSLVCFRLAKAVQSWIKKYIDDLINSKTT